MNKVTAYKDKNGGLHSTEEACRRKNISHALLKEFVPANRSYVSFSAHVDEFWVFKGICEKPEVAVRILLQECPELGEGL